MNLIPYSRYVRTVPCSEKVPFLREFLDARDTPLTITVAPRENLVLTRNISTPVRSLVHSGVVSEDGCF